MSQFDVYENKNDATRRAYPYLLNIQSEVLSALNTLIVMTPQVAAVPRKNLSEPVGSLAHLRTEIVGALDFAVGGV